MNLYKRYFFHLLLCMTSSFFVLEISDVLLQDLTNFYNEFLVVKSEKKGEKFDLLVLAKKDLKKAVIPSFIKRITPYSFSGCSKLETVTFSDDSQLTIIDKVEV